MRLLAFGDGLTNFILPGFIVVAFSPQHAPLRMSPSNIGKNPDMHPLWAIINVRGSASVSHTWRTTRGCLTR